MKANESNLGKFVSFTWEMKTVSKPFSIIDRGTIVEVIDSDAYRVQINDGTQLRIPAENVRGELVEVWDLRPLT